MKLHSDVPNQGYIIHPSLFDGTIHAVCATMFDQDPPFLKIFAGVGKVTVVCKEAPKDEAVVLHLAINEKTEQWLGLSNLCVLTCKAADLHLPSLLGARTAAVALGRRDLPQGAAGTDPEGSGGHQGRLRGIFEADYWPKRA